MPQPDENHDLAYRVSHLEVQIAETTPEETTTTRVATTTNSSTSGLRFTSIPETALGLTQDAAWHTITVPGVPVTAVGLRILVKMFYTQLVTANVFQVSKEHVSGDIITVTSMTCNIGSNEIETEEEFNPWVGATFDYYIDNDGDWIVTAMIQGYWE